MVTKARKKEGGIIGQIVKFCNCCALIVWQCGRSHSRQLSIVLNQHLFTSNSTLEAANQQLFCTTNSWVSRNTHTHRVCLPACIGSKSLSIAVQHHNIVDWCIDDLYTDQHSERNGFPGKQLMCKSTLQSHMSGYTQARLAKGHSIPMVCWLVQLPRNVLVIIYTLTSEGEGGACMHSQYDLRA